MTDDPTPSTYTGLLATVTVRDLDRAREWYGRLFDRPADRSPMPGLIEWDVAAGGAVQVFQGEDAAGTASITLVPADLDRQVGALRDRGVDVPDPTTGTGARFATLTDPDGNTVVLATTG